MIVPSESEAVRRAILLVASRSALDATSIALALGLSRGEWEEKLARAHFTVEELSEIGSVLGVPASTFLPRRLPPVDGA